MDNDIALALLPRVLSDCTGKPAPNYRRVYMSVLDGRLAAHQKNGRWHVRRADLPEIAALLGLAETNMASA